MTTTQPAGTPTTGVDLISGVTVPVVTPLTSTGAGPRPDAAGYRRLFPAFAAAGVRRIMLLGSNGEGPLLPTETLRPFLGEAVAAWQATGPDRTAVVNVTAAGTTEALLRADLAIGAGADGLVCSPPTYFRHRDDELVAHFAALTALGRPVILYDSPVYSQPISATAFAGLLALPGLVGIKDSAGDLAEHRARITAAHAAGVRIAQGGEAEALDALEAGADGIVLGIANLAPALVVGLDRALREGRRDAAVAAQAVITELVGIHRVRRGVPSVKALLAARGLLDSDLALPPLIPCTDDERARLTALVGRHSDHLINPAAP